MSSNLREYGVVAGTGAMTGLLWSFITGQLDPTDSRDQFYAAVGSVGSAVNSIAIYGATDYFSQDPQLPLQITAIWWTAQGAASLANFAGSRFQLKSNSFFNAVTMPLNFAAAPISSSAGTMMGLINSTDVQKNIKFHGGMLVFKYDCSYGVGFTLGSTGHCFGVRTGYPMRHEVIHLKQFSILGDVGVLTITLGDGMYDLLNSSGRPKFLCDGPGFFTYEQWARDHEGDNYDMQHVIIAHEELEK